MLIMKTISGLLLLSIALSSTGWCSFTLNLNTITKEYSLTGSDTGTPGPNGDGGSVYWESARPGGSESGFAFYDDGLFFSSDVIGIGPTGYDDALDVFNGGIGLNLLTSSNAEQTITGEGYFHSYAGFSTDAQTLLESFIGQSITLDSNSSGFSALSVAAVPEPSAAALIAGLVAITCLSGRRQKLR